MHLINIVYIICTIFYVNTSNTVFCPCVTNIHVLQHSYAMFIIFILSCPSIIIALLFYTIVNVYLVPYINSMDFILKQVSSSKFIQDRLIILKIKFVNVKNMLGLTSSNYYMTDRCVIYYFIHHLYSNIILPYSISSQNG